MKRKIEKQFTYEGLGFVVELLNVPMIEVRGIWTPDIDYNLLQKVVLRALAHNPAPLTGNHIKFIRSWLALSQEEFGKIFGVRHSAVVKWEKFRDHSAKISLNTEREIRMHILDALLKKAEDFRNAYHVIHCLEFHAQSLPVSINTQTDLVAI